MSEAPARLLVVDDEPEVRQIVKECLVGHGFSVSTSGGAAQAARKLGEGSFDLVITDICMPGETGIEFVHNLRREQPDIAIIVLTGMADIQLAVHMIKLGVLDYVTKPVDLDRLPRVVRAALESHRKQKRTDPPAA